METNTIEYLVSEYRRLAAEVKGLESEKNEIKTRLNPLVASEEGQKWSDADGHAVIRERKPSVSYPGKEVDNLVQVWSESADPIMRSCGQLLQNLRRVGQPSVYLEIR